MRDVIENAVKSAKCFEIEYKSEWLGFLPFGVYHWVECLGYDFSNEFPSEWTAADLHALEKSGFLEKVFEHVSPTDEFDVCRKYRVNLFSNHRLL